MTTTGEPVVGAPERDYDAIQRRTIGTLLTSQASGGVGLVATYIVSALMAKDITGSKTLATIAASCLSIGAAAVSFPLARMMNKRGRRAGLRLGYLVGAAGAAIAVVGAITRSYPLLCVGIFGAGAGNASNLATRYAASDLAQPDRRGRTISLIIWATTLGSATGAIVSGTASDVGVKLGLPNRVGSYVLSGIMFLVAAAIVELRLRPDPLLMAQERNAGSATPEPTKQLAVREALPLIMANPAAKLAVGAMIVSQVTMVGVMALTPLHMNEGSQSQHVIDLMMVFHIFGMYLFSPVVGWLTDRLGQYPMLYASGICCTAGAAWAATTPPDGRLGVFMGNFLIGLGWCFGVVAASSLLVATFPLEQRVGVQGVGDLAMIGSGAIAGLTSGALYTFLGYGGVNSGNAGFGVLLILGTGLTYVIIRRQTAAARAPLAV